MPAKDRGWLYVAAAAAAYVFWRIIISTVLDVVQGSVRSAFGLDGHGSRGDRHRGED